jgi:small-conductance mechanosensitive channel
MTDLTAGVSQWLADAWQAVGDWFASPAFYAQLAGSAVAIALAFLVAFVVTRNLAIFRDPPKPGVLYRSRTVLFRLGPLVFPLLLVLLLGIAVEVADSVLGHSGLVRLTQGLAAVFLLYSFISRFVHQKTVRTLALWLGVPIATLQVFGWLDEVTDYLDGISLTAGNIRVSLLAFLRTVIFGALLFWLGRISASAGKQAIRNRQTLDAGTREVFAKLFEIALFVCIFLLLLQVMGINLTALAVFGGALGVGLGFGLQQIASNFVSGIIILLDRSITIGDHIELEDGRFGVLREMNLRCGVIETYDGKDVMVPNEQFITSSYVNWTHKNKKQRYSLEFSVAYHTDLHALFNLVREVVASHPQVLSGPDFPLEEQPDAEIKNFGDSGVDILVEFWMEGVDDGKNRVGADLMHSIWRSIQEHGMEIPFPQREVRILRDQPEASPG